MNIKIYGTGCPKCKALKANAEAALRAAHVEGTIEKIQDMNAIVAAGVMSTPALEIDGKIVSTGKVLSPKEIAALLGPGGGSAAAPAPAEGTSCSCGGACSCGGKSAAGKKTITGLLLLFVVASVIVVAAREAMGRGCAGGSCPIPAAPAAAAPAAVPAAKDVLTVYYFHGNQRCMTCNKIEQMAREAVTARYADAMKAGAVVFRSVNLDEPGNEHFVNDFQLTSRIVVVERNGKHENLDQVWTLVHGDPAKFAAYIQDGAARMMSAAK